MIYTIGHKESYERYFEEQKQPQKLGRTSNYSGGSVWKTKEEAQQYCAEDFAIYGVMADWDTETELNANGMWHDLLVTANLVRI